MYLYVCLFVYAYMHMCVYVWKHLQRLKVNSLIKPCGSQGSKLGHSSDLGQAPLPTDPSLQHKIQFHFWKPTSHLPVGKLPAAVLMQIHWPQLQGLLSLAHKENCRHVSLILSSFLFRWKLEGRGSMNYICYTICYTHICVYSSSLSHTGLLSPNRRWYVTLVRLESSACSPKSPRIEDQTVVKFVLSDESESRQPSMSVERCSSSSLRPHILA